jgi:hypothetical protein
MIIILNDDPVYVSWLRRHRSGFVLDTRQKVTKRNTTLHRASCAEIRHAKTRRTHWTTRGRVKACSEHCGELTDWVREQIGTDPTFCDVCDPGRDLSQAEFGEASRHSDHHLTKLDNDILSAVLESAVIHLDNGIEFRLTVGDVAQYLSKTPAQLAVALSRLVSEQMLEVEEAATNGEQRAPTTRVFPTARSLCTVPAFAEMDSNDLERELASLHT